VPEAVIEEFHASINHRFFRPDRAEGFATIVALNPAAGEGTSDDDLRARLLQICNPPPQGDLASWQEVHGGNSDIDADAAASGVNGGHPALADRQALRRVFTLLRQILKEPFDAADGDGETAPPASAPASSGSAPARPKRARRSSDEFSPLYRHLIDRLSPIEGACAAKQEAVLRHDIEHLLGPMASSPK
jgi:hypothetical protein